MLAPEAAEELMALVRCMENLRFGHCSLVEDLSPNAIQKLQHLEMSMAIAAIADQVRPRHTG